MIAVGASIPCGATLGRAASPLMPEVKSHRGKRFTFFRMDPAARTIGLYLSGSDGRPLRTFGKLEEHLAPQGKQLVLAMNGGMFEADGSPVGWCVAEGKTIRGPNQDTGKGNFFLKPNGVFAMEAGKAMVLETSLAMGKLKRAELITQSGPLLVIGGQFHPAFHRESANRNIRNAVGVTRDGGVCFAISEEPVTFHESATFFLDELGCPDALFLDGGISRLYAPKLGRNGGSGLLGPLLAVTQPAGQ